MTHRDDSAAKGTAGGPNALGKFLSDQRVLAKLTQEELAERAGISADSVRRHERGDYNLPTKPRTGGHALDKILHVFGFGVYSVLKDHFSHAEIAQSAYASYVTGRTPRQPGERPSLQSYIDELPLVTDPLTFHGALFNAHAMAFVINLERHFDRYEMLVTNQPPFMLFADHEYVTQGSASRELAEEDRHVYHEMIFEHQTDLQERVRANQKHYKVVLHYGSLIDFLASRSIERCTSIVSNIEDLLRFPAFTMVILDQPDALDEYEVLSRSYPFDAAHSISVSHRRIGIANTQVYQPSVTGAVPELVLIDHAKAETFWNAALHQYRDCPPDYGNFQRQTYTVRDKRITARLLEDALESAHPQPPAPP